MDYSIGVLNTMCSPFFPELRADLGPYLVDKTKLIENIVVNNHLRGHVDLVLRPRRCGKSTMLQMLKSFFSIPQNDDPDPRLLFEGLYIASREDICTGHMGKYPVIFCDFKNLTGRSWEGMLSNFKDMVSFLYMEWRDCLMQSLNPAERTYFESICLMMATEDDLTRSLYRLSYFLARQFGRKVIVLIDEYEAPNNWAFEDGFFKEANRFFGCGVLPFLLKSNKDLQYVVLAGITPTAKTGWYSGLNNLEVHALHTSHSIFSGMLMFTEHEVIQLGTLSNRKLKLEDLKAHYNSYTASAGYISVYNPVSVMSAFKRSSIENFWVATGEFPLLNREFPDDGLNVVEDLLAGAEIQFKLMESVTNSNMTLSTNATLTLLYYAGYLTVTISGRFKIPNPEVMIDWARWVVGGVPRRNILQTCVEGPISDFEAKWPNFMKQVLDPKLVAETRGAISRKTPEKTYNVLFLGLMQSLRGIGWEVIVEARAGGSFVDLRLLHKQKRKGVLIELKSSEKEGDLEGDANRALEQIAKKNYRNLESLRNILFLREYGIAGFHLSSCVKGRHLEFNSKTGQWVEEDEVRGRGALSQECRTESSGESKKRKADGTGADGGRARKR